MKKLITLSLLLLSVMTISASKKYADLSADQTHGNGTWTASTKTFAWTASSSAYMELTGLNGNLTDYTSLVLETADYTASFRVDFVYEDADGKDQVLRGRSGSYGSSFYSGGTKTVNLATNLADLTDTQKQNIKAIRINTNSTSGSITINKAYLDKPLTSLTFVNGSATLDLTDLTVTGADFDDQTGVITSTGAGTISVSLPSDGIDLSSVETIVVDHEGDITDYAIVKNNGEQFYRPYNSRYNMSFTGDNDKTRNQVTEISWHISASKAGTMTIKSITFNQAGTTAIRTINSNGGMKKDGATYDMQGRRVNGSYKGLVIRNGKKYIQR